MRHARALKYIFVIASITAIVFPLATIYYVFPAFGEIALSSAREESVRIAEHLASMVVTEDGRLRDPHELEPFVLKAQRDFHIEKIKVFSPEGEVVYSTNPADAGKTNTRDYFRDVVARGNIFSKMVRRDSPTLEDRIVRADVMETYVPITEGGSVLGAFEIYYDVTKSLERMNALVFRSSLILFGLVLGFFVSSGLLFLRAEKSPGGQEETGTHRHMGSPLPFLLLIAFSIFVAEAMVMLFVHVLPPLSPLELAALDATLLVMLVSPTLYFFLVRPFLEHIRVRREAEEELRRHKGHLEELVEQRTADLSRSHARLETEITEHTKAQQALRESEQRYRSLFENATDLIQIVAPDGRLMYVNRAWRETLGYTDADIKGLGIGDLVVAEHREECAKLFECVRDTGAAEHVETALLGKDGRTVLLEGSCTCHYKDGEAVFIQSIFRDVTERKKLEDQLRHAQKMEALGTLTGGVAHEFNNIMTAVLGFSEFLQEELGADSPLRVYADYIQSSALRAARLTEGLLAYSRRQLTHKEPVDVNELILLVRGFLSRIVPENVHVRTEASAQDLVVTADRGQIEQVLINLCTNALDAMPRGGTLGIRADRVAIEKETFKHPSRIQPGEYIRLAVSDTGQGMSKDTLVKIFEPFFTTREVGKGTGLGLSMVYGIVKKHGGYVTVESKPEAGSTFEVYLPLGGRATRTDSPALPAEGKETVLVAEDDRSVRHLISQVLERYGYRPLTAADGQEALRTFKEHERDVDLLILDIAMPKKRGDQAFEEIRRMRPDIKVIFITGYAAPDVHAEEILDNGYPVLQKPISPKDLLATVSGVLR
ncbi:MAG: PAS domain S-box protein [Nitrospirota bacterium]